MLNLPIRKLPLLKETEDKPSKNLPVEDFRLGPDCRVGLWRVRLLKNTQYWVFFIPIFPLS
jgi:hypothetical protein